MSTSAMRLLSAALLARSRAPVKRTPAGAVGRVAFTSSSKPGSPAPSATPPPTPRPHQERFKPKSPRPGPSKPAVLPVASSVPPVVSPTPSATASAGAAPAAGGSSPRPPVPQSLLALSLKGRLAMAIKNRKHDAALDCWRECQAQNVALDASA